MRALHLVPLLLLPLSVAATQPIRTPAQLEAHLQAAGYRNLFDIDLDDGLWEAKARKPGGLWREVAVDPASGRIFDGTGARSVEALNVVSKVVGEHGYTMLELAEPDGPLWEVDASDANGLCFGLRVDAVSQTIVKRLPDDC